MGDGLDTKAVRTRQRILASAAREFAARGFDGTSLRQVAAGADLTLGSLYFHFATKADLVAEVLRDAVDFALARVDQAISELPSEAGTAEALSAAVRAHLLEMAGDRRAAAGQYRLAAQRALNVPEQRYLSMRADRTARPRPHVDDQPLGSG